MPEPIALPALHRAWICYQGEQPQDLSLKQSPLPRPGLGQVLIRNRVIGLNPVDWKVLGAWAKRGIRVISPASTARGRSWRLASAWQ